ANPPPHVRRAGQGRQDPGHGTPLRRVVGPLPAQEGEKTVAGLRRRAFGESFPTARRLTHGPRTGASCAGRSAPARTSAATATPPPPPAARTARTSAAAPRRPPGAAAPRGRRSAVGPRRATPAQCLGNAAVSVDECANAVGQECV